MLRACRWGIVVVALRDISSWSLFVVDRRGNFSHGSWLRFHISVVDYYAFASLARHTVGTRLLSYT